MHQNPKSFRKNNSAGGFLFLCGNLLLIQVELSIMYPQLFEIQLEQESTRFLAGQIISGRVVLILRREKAVKGIIIRLIGKGTVSWEGGISGIKYSQNHYADKEVYADIKNNLLGRDDGREEVLEAGRHDYFFSIQIPPNLPSTFEGQHGAIQYNLEAAIQRSWKDDYTTSFPLEIRGLIDLNSEPKAAEPVKIFKEKHVGIMLCQNGPLAVNVLLSKAGFIPGDYLQFGVEIRSSANVKISAVIVSLRKHITYKVGTEKKSQAEKVVQCVGPSVEMKGYLIWQNHFVIPDLPPNPLTSSKLMELQYYLEIKLALERWYDLKICTPVVIGAIPYGVSETKAYISQKVNHTSARNSVMGMNSESKAISNHTTPHHRPHQHHQTPQNQNHHTPHHQPHFQHLEQYDAQTVPELGVVEHSGNNEMGRVEGLPLITGVDNPEYTLPLLDWGSSACLAELEKITSRPVQTVPSFLLSASENLYAMSMGSCDKLSTNYEILDDRHILFEDDEAFVDICSSQLQNLFLKGGDENGTKEFYG